MMQPEDWPKGLHLSLSLMRLCFSWDTEENELTSVSRYEIIAAPACGIKMPLWPGYKSACHVRCNTCCFCCWVHSSASPFHQHLESVHRDLLSFHSQTKLARNWWDLGLSWPSSTSHSWVLPHNTKKNISLVAWVCTWGNFPKPCPGCSSIKRSRSTLTSIHNDIMTSLIWIQAAQAKSIVCSQYYGQIVFSIE